MPVIRWLQFFMQWRPSSNIHLPVTVKTLEPWLKDKGSLTQRLIHLSGNRFHVQLLNQAWGRARWDEAKALAIDARHRCLIREVLLLGMNQQWVYARSILPSSSLNSSLGFLRRLGNKPLGALLFKDPTMERGPIEIAHIPSCSMPLHINSSAWGRRSVFYLSGQPLLVSEVFLPDFIAAIQH